MGADEKQSEIPFQRESLDFVKKAILTYSTDILGAKQAIFLESSKSNKQQNHIYPRTIS